jgi:PHD/YefM family antitoxin component YafN of YafNO toxin-antitoxin module
MREEIMPAQEPIKRPLSELETHTVEWVEELRNTELPLVLTVDDQATVIMQDAASYRRMVDRLEELETIQAIQAGIDDVAAGRTIPVAEAMEQLREKFGLRG